MNARELEELSWRFAEVYEAVTNRILINLARHFRYLKPNEISGSWEYQVKMLAQMGQVNRETEQIILSMLGDADGVLKGLLEESIANGLKDAEPELRKAAEKGLLNGGVPSIHPSQMQAFNAYYTQSADKLNLVNTVMLESTEWAYQSTVADIVTRMNNTQGILNVATGEVVTGVSSYNQAIRDGVKKMVENGITGFIDHGGHKWTPEAYVAMDVRSTMANTARAAVFERCEQYGNDLYQVSWHNAARPLCFPWQTKVISRTDTVRDVEDDEGNTVHVYAQSETTYGEPAGLFGINCGHYPIPFISGFSRIRQPRQDAEENAEAYQSTQKQRYLERKLRDEKRDLEVLKAQGASEDELKIQRQKIRKASKDIDEFCEETGLHRRRNRETAPVRATWPDESSGTVERFRGEYKITQIPPSKPILPTIPTDTPAGANAASAVSKSKATDAVERAVGVKKGTPFSIQEAAQYANPEYKAGGAYRENCQRCVAAYELRRRGYDVEALPKNMSNDKIVWGSEIFNGYGTSLYTAGRAYKFDLTAKQIKKELSDAPDGSRYSIYIRWKKSRNSAHVFVAEKDNGVVKYIDPQKGKTNVSDYFERGQRKWFGFFRMDDKPITNDETLISETVRKGRNRE